MDEPTKKRGRAGRPKNPDGAKTKFIQARMTEPEYRKYQQKADELGISISEMVLDRLANNAGFRQVNSKELLRKLDTIGTAMGRCGNNINQLARHANTLIKQGQLPRESVNNFIPHFREYIGLQEQLEQQLRQLLRVMRR